MKRKLSPGHLHNSHTSVGRGGVRPDKGRVVGGMPLTCWNAATLRARACLGGAAGRLAKISCRKDLR